MATSVTSAGLKAASDKIILAARPVVEVLKLFSTDFSVDNSKVGSGIAVEILSATAGDFGAANGYTVPTNTIKPTTVTLTQHKKSTFTISDIDVLENELSPVWGSLAPVSGKAVAKAASKFVIDLLTHGNAKAQIVQDLASSPSLAKFANLRALVEAQDLDPADCTLMLVPTAYAALVSCLPANVIGDSDAVRRAVIGAFLGFKAVVEAPNASTADSATTAKGLGFIVPTGAVAVAARTIHPVKAGGNLIEFGTVQDEETGFVFGSRVVVDADQGTCSWTVDSLFGASLTYDATTATTAPRYLQIKSA